MDVEVWVEVRDCCGWYGAAPLAVPAHFGPWRLFCNPAGFACWFVVHYSCTIAVFKSCSCLCSARAPPRLSHLVAGLLLGSAAPRTCPAGRSRSCLLAAVGLGPHITTGPVIQLAEVCRVKPLKSALRLVGLGTVPSPVPLFEPLLCASLGVNACRRNAWPCEQHWSRHLVR
jgi:hypothetical protein